MHIQRRFLLILAAALLAVGLADAALAQSGLWNDVRGNLTPVGNAFGTPGVPADPRSVVAVVIKIFMGILGIIYLVYTVHAGFVLMTSGGETDKIDQAKSTLATGIIGMLVIFMAYAIVRFVMRAAACATDPFNTWCVFLQGF